ncbi:pheromone processing endoprotease [Tieghemiomyces parasiticus]|uniref:Pheromone processing endoprotease n=1 Tax=Tieghemiomyces parasiticus TaxID=78921 RepID=A0A9W7ZH02_9FUNG|nr:pheromone processing endoprotease [Tieghemiomyces parasiticus]
MDVHSTEGRAENTGGGTRRRTALGLVGVVLLLTLTLTRLPGARALDDDDLHPSMRVQQLNHRDYVYYAFSVKPALLAKRDGRLFARDVSQALTLLEPRSLGDLDHVYLARRPRTTADGALYNHGHQRRSDELVHHDPVLALFNRMKRAVMDPTTAGPSALHRRYADVALGVGYLLLQAPYQRSKRSPIDLPPPVELSPRGALPPITKYLSIKDPLFPSQWHLLNSEDKLHDLNVTDVWREGITGKGIRVGMIDDGLDYTSLDLKDNFDLEGSYDFNNHTKYPTPTTPEDYHGTRCAGEIAAVKNGVCGLGVAYEAKISGLRILSGVITDVDEALSLNYNYQKTSIYSCSWGPADDGKAMEAPNELILDAIINGIQKGRDGKGSVFVFATGNGGYFSDNCNFDGYTNSIYTISVGAIDHRGLHPYYSEPCSAQLVVAYSSGSDKFIATTDRGLDTCTDRHGGTSAAAPLVSGVLALVLQVRPELTWRDLQHLVLQNAVPFDLDHEGWQEVASGRLYNHLFGYGKMDAWKLVQAAKTFQPVNEQTWFEADTVVVNQPIPHGAHGVASSLQVAQTDLDVSYFKRLEHVTVIVEIDHQNRGDVAVELRSPHGYVSYLATPRPLDRSKVGFQQWTFMTVKHWDEDPVGQWTLKVIDETHPKLTGVLRAWTLVLWGEATDESVKNPKGDAEVPKAIPSPSHHIPAADNGNRPLVTLSTSTATSALSTPTTKSVASTASEAAASPSGSAIDPGRSAEKEDGDTVTSHASALGVIIGLVLAILLSAAAIFIRRWMRRREDPKEAYEFAPLPGHDGDPDGDNSPSARGARGLPGGDGIVEVVEEESQGLVSSVPFRDYDDEYDPHPASTRHFSNSRDMYDAFGEEEEDDDATLRANGSGPRSPDAADRISRSGAVKKATATRTTPPVTGHEEGQVLFEISSDVDDHDDDDHSQDGDRSHRA